MSAVKDWAKAHDDEVSDDDPYDMSGIWSTLCFAYHDITTATERSASEATQRQGIDTLIKLAFSSRPSCKAVVL
jgi:hypothetical protein